MWTVPRLEAPSTSASAENAGTCSALELSVVSPTLRGEAAFPFPPIGTGLLFICCLLRRAGRSTVPLGVPHPAAKVREEGVRGLFSQIPLSNHFFPPLGSGQREAWPDCPCAGSPGAGAGTGGVRRELAWINSRSEARRALGPLGHRLRAVGRLFPMQEAPTLQDLCLWGSHRSCVYPPSTAPLFKALKISRSAGPSFLLYRTSRPGPALPSSFPFHQHLDPRVVPSLLSVTTRHTATNKLLLHMLQSCSLQGLYCWGKTHKSTVRLSLALGAKRLRTPGSKSQPLCVCFIPCCTLRALNVGFRGSLAAMCLSFPLQQDS